MTVELGISLFQVAFWIYLAATVCYIAYLVEKNKALVKFGTALVAIGLVSHALPFMVRKAFHFHHKLLGRLSLDVAFWMYFVAAICYIAYFVKDKNIIGKIGAALLVTGLAVHAVSFISRGAALGRLPFLNFYEYILSLTLGAVLVYLVVEYSAKNKSIGAFAVSLITMMVYFGIRLPSEAEPTVPALRSAWRTPHISTAILAYAAFALAFGIAIMYLIRESAEGNKMSFWTTRLPKLDLLDKIIYRVIAFGFLMQTAMLISGSMWAQIAWGKYWSWDPKETFALVTWLIYAVYLHTRNMMGWRGRKSALLALIGFAATIFTLIGVTYLLPGLHSYA